ALAEVQISHDQIGQLIDLELDGGSVVSLLRFDNHSACVCDHTNKEFACPYFRRYFCIYLESLAGVRRKHRCSYTGERQIQTIKRGVSRKDNIMPRARCGRGALIANRELQLDGAAGYCRAYIRSQIGYEKIGLAAT